MNQRINIVLPETMVQTIDRIAPPGERSRFIEQAVRHFISHKSSEAVRARLEQTAVRDRDLDREIAGDWLAADIKSWQQLDTPDADKIRYPPARGNLPRGARPDHRPGDPEGPRPALVIQNDVSNRVSDITIIAPITSTVRFPLNPVHVLLAADSRTGLSVTSVAVFNQIRAVDRIRLTKRLGAVDADTMDRADEAIRISLGLIRL